MGSAGVFPAGQVLMEDVNAAEMMLMFAGRGITATHFKSLNPAWLELGPKGKVLVAGTLAFGDAIMLTPVLRALKEKDFEVYVACPLHTRAALLNLPYIDGFENWPMHTTTVDRYEAVHFLEGFQHHNAARDWHMSDVFATMCGVPVIDKRCDYIPTDDECLWAKETFPRKPGLKRIGIQVQASHRCRTYHGIPLRKVMDLLLKDGWELYMMGRPGEFGCQEVGNIHDASKHAPMFRQSAALLTTCDAFLGPDSGFLHVAGALNVPSVGLFSVFPWQLRTSQYPSVFAIQGVGDCAPCFHTRNNLQPHFPPGKPCNAAQHCTVLAAIEPERIVQLLARQVARLPVPQDTAP